MKYVWIDAQRKAYPLPAMRETLTVSVSGYRAWKRGGSPNRRLPLANKVTASARSCPAPTPPWKPKSRRCCAPKKSFRNYSKNRLKPPMEADHGRSSVVI